jgi:Uma2 family endonuclease
MTMTPNQLETEIFYPISDGEPMAESDPARDYLIYAVEALDIYFQHREDVYVSGNLYIYYTKNVPSAVVAPDAFVVFGVEKKKRLIYKVWEEGGKTPNFVLEITSATTQKKDEEEKPIKYANLGVEEYFQYDPTGDYLQPRLKGSRLVNGQYQPIAAQILIDGVFSIHSQVLGLDLRLIDGELRFFEPQTGKKLLSYKETEQARLAAEQARLAAIPRLLELGLSVEQIASALSLTADEVRNFVEKQ